MICARPLTFKPVGGCQIAPISRPFDSYSTPMSSKRRVSRITPSARPSHPQCDLLTVS
jgi:hypothetical protein